ncbi:MAG: BatD family protein [Spirochaetaceae bacterium]|jgi:hypothetical protein|nr:BatD family protein [Spirochaetaceae bacterium]
MFYVKLAKSYKTLYFFISSGFFLFLLINRPIFAQEEDSAKPLETAIEVSSYVVKENEPFTVTINVYHPYPQDVKVEPPDFSGAIVIESERVESALFTEANESTTKKEFIKTSVVIFTLIPVKSGPILLGPFKIEAAGKTAASWPLQIYAEASSIPPAPITRWEHPQRIFTGEKALVELHLLNGESVKTYGENAPFNIETPENAIINRVAPKNQDSSPSRSKIALSLSVIPLSAGTLIIRGKSAYNGSVFDLPELRLYVNQPTGKTGAEEASYRRKRLDFLNAQGASSTPLPKAAAAVEEARLRPAKGPDFEKTLNKKPASFFKSYKDAVYEIKNLWREKKYAAALSVARRYERNSFLGPFLRPVRAAMEESLGLETNTDNDEKWKPLSLYKALLLLQAAFCCILFLRLKRANAAEKLSPLVKDASNETKKQKKSGFQQFFICFIPAAALAAAALAGLLIKENEAVLREAPAFTLPESVNGEKYAFRFKEGQFVKIKAETKDALYAITTRGDSGWVQKEKAIRF